MDELSLILPTLDERDNVERLIPRLLAELPELLEVLVIDDGSRDGTAELVEEMAAGDARVRLVRRQGTPGLCTAIRAGLERARGDLVGWMDADQAIGPGDVSRLIGLVRGGADVAIASRFAPGGRIKGQSADGTLGRLRALTRLRSSRDPWLGVALSWLLNAAVLPLVVGGGVHDYSSGILIAKRRALDGIKLRGDHGEYFVELWAELVARRRRVVELGYRVEPRRYGRSKTGNGPVDYARRGAKYLAAGRRARRIWPR